MRGSASLILDDGTKPKSSAQTHLHQSFGRKQTQNATRPPGDATKHLKRALKIEDTRISTCTCNNSVKAPYTTKHFSATSFNNLYAQIVKLHYTYSADELTSGWPYLQFFCYGQQ